MQQPTQRLPISEIKTATGKETYPRGSLDNKTIELYRLSVANLPPIKVTPEHVLIDGYHRLQAHRSEGKKEVEVEIVHLHGKTILEAAIEYNSSHGKQLTWDEKRRCAITLRSQKVEQVRIARLLAVSNGAVNNWVRKVDMDKRKFDDENIKQGILAGLTLQEMGDNLGISRPTITEKVKKFIDELEREYQRYVPENLQTTNVWRFSERDPRFGLKHPGNIPGQIVEHLLYYFTEPLDLVIDPMAGGGVTIDVCKVMARKFRAYDLNPMRPDIFQNNIATQGYPTDCKKAKLFFLDPPYGNMAFDFFKDLGEFYEFLDVLSRNTAKVMKKGSICAILMMDQTDRETMVFSGEAYKIFSRKMKPLYGISCPQTAEFRVPQYVEKMKERKLMLGINRAIWVFRKE